MIASASGKNGIFWNFCSHALFATAVSFFCAFTASAVDVTADQSKVPFELRDVQVSEHLGSTLRLQDAEGKDLRVRDETGQTVALKTLLQTGKPTLFTLAYYRCPMLCTMVLSGMLDGSKNVDWSMGKEFNVVTLSIDPSETPELAAKKKETHLAAYSEAKGHDLSSVQQGWHFLVSDEKTIRNVADQLGFGYRYDTDQEQYAHPAVVFALTPDSKISRYLYGIQFKSSDLRLALLEASQGKIGNVFDRLLLFCYHYEPGKKGYSLRVLRVMQVASVGTVLILGSFLILFWRRERKKRKESQDV